MGAIFVTKCSLTLQTDMLGTPEILWEHDQFDAHIPQVNQQRMLIWCQDFKTFDRNILQNSCIKRCMDCFFFPGFPLSFDVSSFSWYVSALDHPLLLHFFKEFKQWGNTKRVGSTWKLANEFFGCPEWNTIGKKPGRVTKSTTSC